MNPPRLCTCTEHAAGADATIGRHTYRLESRYEDDGGEAWRAGCSCGATRFRWQYQSPSVAYHAWLGHVSRCFGGRPVTGRPGDARDTAPLSPDAAELTRRKRLQLVRAVLLMELASTVERWRREVLDLDGGRPFTQWPDDDVFVTLLRTYGITRGELASMLDRVGGDLEAQAEAADYAHHLDPIPPPTTRRTR